MKDHFFKVTSSCGGKCKVTERFKYLYKIFSSFGKNCSCVEKKMYVVNEFNKTRINSVDT